MENQPRCDHFYGLPWRRFLKRIESYNRQRAALSRRDDRERFIVWRVSLSSNNGRNLTNAVSRGKAKDGRIGANTFDDYRLLACVVDDQLHAAFVQFKIQMRGFSDHTVIERFAAAPNRPN
jgi:hypothetical protein